jgi:hypothetical protein
MVHPFDTGPTARSGGGRATIFIFVEVRDDIQVAPERVDAGDDRV